MSVLEDLERLSAAEDFFVYLDVPFEAKIVQVARLHILRRMGQYIKGSQIDGAFEMLKDAAIKALCKEHLEQAYQDFVEFLAAQGAVVQGAQGCGRTEAGQTPRAHNGAHGRKRGITKMHIVVCIKQVPDSAQIRVHPVTNTIMRQGVPTIINPYDLFALEEALRMRDKVGGKVTVLTMGPPTAEDALRRALTFGVDRAVLLTDRAFAGSDTLATSFALASALSKIGREFGEPRVVFTGKQTIDGDTAQVGPGIAKRLKLNQLTYVAKIVAIKPAEAEIVVERRAEGGMQTLSTQASRPDHHA